MRGVGKRGKDRVKRQISDQVILKGRNIIFVSTCRNCGIEYDKVRPRPEVFKMDGIEMWHCPCRPFESELVTRAVIN